jgi:hypothetical protein
MTAVLLLWAAAASAQSLGTFKWQLLPFCNVVSLTITQAGNVYTVRGTDDQCGARADKASVAGSAFLNPGGTIGMGLAIVTTPGGAPVHVDALIDPGSLSGTWRDSEGNTGTYIFTPLSGIPGAARPAPRGTPAPGSITAVELAPAAVGTAQLGAAAVNVPAIANGSITGVKFADNAITAAKIGDRARAGFASGDQDLQLTTTGLVVRTLDLTAPSAGRLVVVASGTITGNESVVTVRCSLTAGQAIDPDHEMTFSEVSSTQPAIPFALTRAFNVPAGPAGVNLFCAKDSNNSAAVSDSSMTAQFIPVP